jgi:TatA/E family protein of Tat protein translocase
MFGTLGGPELFLILVVALIVFGPRKLPDIGKSLGRMMNEFRKASNEFKQTLEDEVEADKRRESTRVEALPAPADATPGPGFAAAVEPASEAGAAPGPGPYDPAPAFEPAVGAPAEPVVSREETPAPVEPK